MLHTPPLISELAAKGAADEIERQNDILEAGIVSHNHFIRLLNEVASEFERTGLGQEPKESWSWCGYREQGRFDWRAFVRRIARELKRPYVFVPIHGFSLVVEKKAYTRPLYAHLLLVSKEKVGHDWKSVRGADIYHTQTGSSITFMFLNDFGKRAYDDWLERAKDDLAFRKALRLT